MTRLGATLVLLLAVFNGNTFAQSQTASKKISNEITGTGIPSGGSERLSSSSIGSSASGPSALNDVPLQHSNVAVNDQYRDYGANYYYPAYKQALWNRDSYVDAASEFGHNPGAQQHPQQGGHSYVPSSEYGVAEGHEDGGAGGFGGFGGLGGLGGLAGILGVKGVKGLGILALIKAAGIPLLALLLPALILLPLVFLFLPVPVITIPSTAATGRSIGGFGLGDVTARVSKLARSVLDSEKCVERMSCEISRMSRGSFMDRTLKRIITKFEAQLPKPLLRMARAYMDQNTYCNQKYSCYLVDETPAAKKSL